MRTLPRAVPLALLACLLVTGIALADPTPPGGGPGGVLAKFSDWTAAWDPAGNLVGMLAPGVEGRSILYGTSLSVHNIPLTTGIDHADYWSPGGSGEELNALDYDFVVPGAVGGILWEWQGAGYVPTGASGIVAPSVAYPQLHAYFVAGPRMGGRVDVWLDTTPDFLPTLGPGLWVPGATQDDFPGASDLKRDGVTLDDATLWLSGTFVPLFDDVNGNLYRDLGEVDQAIWDPSGDDVFVGGVRIDASLDDQMCLEYTTMVQLGTVGASHAWVDWDSGSLNPAIAMDHLDKSGSQYNYDAYFQANTYGPQDLWPASSNDPVVFAVIPEPVSMVFFGTIMVGAVASALRKRRS